MATLHNIPLITTITGARASVSAIQALRAGGDEGAQAEHAWGVRPLQEYFPAAGKDK